MTLGGKEYEPYKELASAIVWQACADYIDALIVIDEGGYLAKRRRMTKRKKKTDAQKMAENLIKAKQEVKDCEKFFRSDWFVLLMPDAEPDVLIRLLQKKAVNRERMQVVSNYEV